MHVHINNRALLSQGDGAKLQ